MINLIQPSVSMDMALSSTEHLIELYKEEFKVDPTTVIYGEWNRGMAISIFHSIPDLPMHAWIAARISQVYFIPHLGSCWGVLGVEGMAMSGGAR